MSIGIACSLFAPFSRLTVHKYMIQSDNPKHTQIAPHCGAFSQITIACELTMCSELAAIAHSHRCHQPGVSTFHPFQQSHRRDRPRQTVVSSVIGESSFEPDHFFSKIRTVATVFCWRSAQYGLIISCVP